MHLSCTCASKLAPEVPALRVGARIDVAHVASDRNGVLVLVEKFSKKFRGPRRHLALQAGELLHGVHVKGLFVPLSPLFTAHCCALRSILPLIYH